MHSSNPLILIIVLKILSINHVTAQVAVTLPHGGSLAGTTMTTVGGRTIYAYMSIPYAQPPVGRLRFREPLPARPWTGIKAAYNPPPPCPQVNIYSEDKTPFGQEDCLYLNVYSPVGTVHRNYPVMVWIHGGAFHLGSSDPASYGPDRILDNDVILVTLNYRLGVLGFLSTGTSDLPGNYGLKDQVLAFKWVKENIKVFGGNPDDVTIFGQSAGAASVSLHMVSEQSKGIFHKAILQSGNLFDPWAIFDKEKSIERLRRLGELVDCPLDEDDYDSMVLCLRSVPATRLASFVENLYIDGIYPPNTFLGPVVEPDSPDAFLPEDPRNILDSHGHKVPIIIGHTANEGVWLSAPILNLHDTHFRSNFETLLPKLLEYEDKPDHIKSRITQRIDSFYFNGVHDWSKSNHHKLTNMFQDRLISSGMDQFLRNRFASFKRPLGKTYVYIFNHLGPTSATQAIGGGPDIYGVSHNDDLQFLFPYEQLNVAGTSADKTMRWAMPKMWTDFAKSGNPTPRDTKIREYWKSAYDYPLRFAKIGRQEVTEYSENLLETLYSGHNATSIITSTHRSGKSRNNHRHKPRSSESSDSSDSSDSSSDSSAENGNGGSNSYVKILRNNEGFIEKRMKFWRNLEKLLAI